MAIGMGLAIVVGMFAIAKHNFLLFHSLSELFSVAVAWAVFLVVWNSRRFLGQGCFQLLGIAYLFVGSVDLLHTLSYGGMGVFNSQNPDLATQLWIGARYLEAVSLLAAAVLLTRTIRLGGFTPIMAVYAAVAGAMGMSIFAWDVFPACMVEGEGLTTFKIASEGAVIAVLGVAGALFYRARKQLDRRVFALLTASIALTIAAEATFTLYTDVDDLANQTGHLLKIASFYLIYAALIREGLQRPLAVLFHDLKQQTDALAEKTHLAETLLRSMPCVALLIRPSTREIVASNEAAGDADTAAGATCFRTWRKRQTPCQWCLSPDEWAAGLPQRKEVEHGGGVWDIHWMPVSDDLCLHYAFDITETRQVERQRRQLTQQTQHTQKLESLGALAGGIAHDFNNLLMVIQGNADLAMHDLPPGNPARMSVEEIKKASLRAANLTGQMLAYSGRGRFVVKPLDINKLVEDATGTLARTISKKIALGFEFAPDLPLVDADENQMRQLIVNLITNASEAIGEDNGVITFATSVVAIDAKTRAETYLDDDPREGPYVCLKASDTGCGMDEEAKEKLFDPFFTTKATGRGLGMAAVLGILRGHHGVIAVDSKVGQGTTIKMLLPCAEQPVATEDPPKLAEPVSAENGKSIVLVVDDEPSVRNVACMMLQRAGYTVLTADDGRQAVEAYEQYADRIAVVILDMIMPSMGGNETFTRLQQIRRNVRVILTSGHTRQEAIGCSSNAGSADFIQKPFEMNVLIAKVNEIVLGRRSEVARDTED